VTKKHTCVGDFVTNSEHGWPTCGVEVKKRVCLFREGLQHHGHRMADVIHSPA
jgi:hypothetical protein